MLKRGPDRRLHSGGQRSGPRLFEVQRARELVYDGSARGEPYFDGGDGLPRGARQTAPAAFLLAR
jgi:hypothetical protein